MKPIRVLVVDDSATMRGLIVSYLTDAGGIEIVGEAANALEAREAIKRLNPDVLTLDIEMPHMNGLEFLERIMRLRPMPVIIISTLTRRGADSSIRALELGAIDCIEKPRPGNEDSLLELPARVRMAARVANITRVQAARSQMAEAPPPVFPDGSHCTDRIVAIGASTGGVETLMAILRAFPENCPPTVIVQHMPPLFTESLAARLDKICRPRVAVATTGAPVVPGVVYIAPGGDRHLEITGKTTKKCRLVAAPRVNGHCPSVDMLFHSVAHCAGEKSIGVLLTGMGQDGALGLLAMHRKGALTLAQDESTCVVFGMPRAAIEFGAADIVAPLEGIAIEILIPRRREEKSKENMPCHR